MKVILQAELVQKAIAELVVKVVDVVPKIFMSLVLLIIGFIIAKVVAKIVKTTLSKMGINKIGDKLNEIDIIQKNNVDIKIGDILAKFLYYFILLFFAVAASSVLGIPEISKLVSDILTFIPNIIVALIVLVLGMLIADALRKFIGTTLKSLGVASAGLISSILFYFLFINVIIIALSQAKIDTGFLSQNISIIIAGAVGAFAIGYGLASKDVMANMVASFYNKNQFQVGDKITIDGTTGVVSNIGKNTLTVKTETGKAVFPLSITTNQKIEFHD